MRGRGKERNFSSAANKRKSCVAPQTQESDVVGPASLQIGCTLEKADDGKKGRRQPFSYPFARRVFGKAAPCGRLGEAYDGLCPSFEASLRIFLSALGGMKPSLVPYSRNSSALHIGRLTAGGVWRRVPLS